MAYNPNILREVLRARSLTREQLSKRLGLSVTQLESELQREPEPRQGILNDIAKELALPPFIFFMERAPQFHDVLPDFRSPNPAPRAKSRETIEAIHFAEGIQRTVIEGRVRGAPQLPAFTATNNDDVDEFALAARRFSTSRSRTSQTRRTRASSTTFAGMDRRKGHFVFMTASRMPMEAALSRTFSGSRRCHQHDAANSGTTLFTLHSRASSCSHGQVGYLRSVRARKCDRAPLQSLRWRFPCAPQLCRAASRHLLACK